MTAAKTGPLNDLTGFISDSNEVIRELRRESDRGAALVGADYLDRLIEELASARMIDDSRHVKKLLTYPGPLNTAASKADLAFALGWIGPQVYGDLARVRQIRNRFGHSHRNLSFDDPEISQMCGKFAALEFARPYRLRKSRDQFLYGTLALVLQLTELCQRAQRPERGIDPPVRRLSVPPKTSHFRPN